MAGEIIGKTYEALIYVVLTQLRGEGAFQGSVFWNETPDGISVEPDFIIGVDKNHPQYVFMVTHVIALHASEKKTWRNIGELCEIKKKLTPTPYVINIVFDALIKSDLKKIQEAIFDKQLLIGDSSYGRDIKNWVDLHSGEFPTEQLGKANAIIQRLSTNKELVHLVHALKQDMKMVFGNYSVALQSLWDREHNRNSEFSITARNTHYRHGLAKRLLAGSAIDNDGKIDDRDGQWLSELGLVTKVIGKYRIIDPALSWFMETEYKDDYASIGEINMTEGFKVQLSKVRSLSLLSEYGQYFIDNLERLKTWQGMLDCLKEQYGDPAARITVPDEVVPPTNVWIYDYVAALIKSLNRKSMSFGYAIFANHKQANSSKIGNMTIGDWTSCFINQFFNRKPDFSLPNGVLEYVATVLSDCLNGIESNDVVNAQKELVGQYIAKEYTISLMAHRGFDPLLSLMIKKQVAKLSDVKTIKSCFAEKAGVPGRSGNTTVLHIKNTMINWQTATDAGKDHKRKELCGRAVAIRYTWNKEQNLFIERDAARKLILFLDGTWRQKDLDALIAAGWDEIYYPDEIDKLKAAIV